MENELKTLKDRNANIFGELKKETDSSFELEIEVEQLKQRLENGRFFYKPPHEARGVAPVGATRLIYLYFSAHLDTTYGQIL